MFKTLLPAATLVVCSVVGRADGDGHRHHHEPQGRLPPDANRQGEASLNWALSRAAVIHLSFLSSSLEKKARDLHRSRRCRRAVMEARAKLLGHPIHQMLIVFP